MKELEWYLGATYSDSCQPAIMTETEVTFHDPDIPTITDLVTERPKTDAEMTYLEKKNTDESIRQNLRNKDVYKSDMQNIYNLIVGQTNEQLQDKASSDATFSGGQDWPIPDRLSDDPKEALIIKSFQAAPNPLLVPVYKSYVAHHAVRQREHHQLLGQVPQRPEG